MYPNTNLSYASQMTLLILNIKAASSTWTLHKKLLLLFILLWSKQRDYRKFCQSTTTKYNKYEFFFFFLTTKYNHCNPGILFLTFAKLLKSTARQVYPITYERDSFIPLQSPKFERQASGTNRKKKKPQTIRASC